MSRARGLQLYALLLRLYPKASRREYEAGMIEMFALRGAGLLGDHLGTVKLRLTAREHSGYNPMR